MYNLTASDAIVDMPVIPTHTLERLAELARGLPAATEGDAYFRALITAAAELTGSAGAALLEYDQESGRLRFAVAPPALTEALSAFHIPVESSLEGMAVRTASPILIQDVNQDRRHFQPADAARGMPTRSLLVVPLKFTERILGVFEVLNKEQSYTGDDLLILETLAALAASALNTHMLERQIRHSLEEMTRLDRLKSDFIGISSHELRTPLGLILGHATFLREMLDERYSEQVEAIIRNATRLKEIIEELSSVENYQSGTARVRLRKVSIGSVVEEVALSFEPFAREKSIELKTDLPAEELLVEAESGKIAIALSNLVKNALTYTNENGHVVIHAESIPGHVRVSVTDDGIGIPASDLPHIFERFFQVESHLTRRFGGMGLGLSVARAMIEMHGGRIWAESTEGKGTMMSFLLPMERREAPVTRPFSVPI